MITYRILRVAHDIKATRRVGRLYRATRIIAESGILYTLTSILGLVATQVNRNDTLAVLEDVIVRPAIVYFA